MQVCTSSQTTTPEAAKYPNVAPNPKTAILGLCEAIASIVDMMFLVYAGFSRGDGVCVFVTLSGEGMFGKVYTAVNMDTGAYMAMKEVSNDDCDIFTMRCYASSLGICYSPVSVPPFVCLSIHH